MQKEFDQNSKKIEPRLEVEESNEITAEPSEELFDCKKRITPDDFLLKVCGISKKTDEESNYIAEFMNIIRAFIFLESINVYLSHMDGHPGFSSYEWRNGGSKIISAIDDGITDALSVFLPEKTDKTPEGLYRDYFESIMHGAYDKKHSAGAVFPLIFENKILGYLVLEISESEDIRLRENLNIIRIATDIMAIYLNNARITKDKISDDEFIHALFELASDHIFIKDLNHRFVRANRAMLDFFKITEKELIGKTEESIFPEEYSEKLSHINEDVLTGNRKVAEINIKYMDKNSIFEVKHTPIYSIDNKITGLCGIARDVTEFRRTQSALTESEEQFRILVETAEDYIMIHDMDGKIEYLNPSGQKSCGYSLNEMKKMRITDFLTPISKEDAIQRFYLRNEGFDKKNIYEADFVGKNGKATSLEICSTLLKINGKKDRILLIARDITRRIESEKKLKESEERYALAFEGANDGLWDWDIKNKKLTVSARLKKLLGYDYVKIDTIEDFYRLTVPLNTHEIFRAINDHIKGKTDYYSQEIQLKDSKGSYKWFLIRGKAVSGENGEHLRMCGSLTDIDLRKNMEYRLRKSELRYKSLLESQSDLIVRIDTKGILTYVNESFCNTFDIKKENAIGRSIFDFELFEDAQKDRILLKNANADKHNSLHYKNLENRVISKDGTKWFSWDCSAIRDDDNNITYIQAVGRNIDELKQAKEAAINANLTKSEFLANMSHEIRTPMNGILGMLKLLKRTNEEEERQEYMDLAISSGERLLKLLNEILDLSKIEANKIILEEKEFSLKTIVNDTVLTFKKPCAEKGIEIAYEFDGNLSDSYFGDPDRISQILFNLISNSYKFTESGSIKISVEKFESRSDFDNIQIVVRDTGIGIPDENIEEIFQSFRQLNMNTKYSGTGLGLSIVKQLLNHMNGNITVRNIENSGSEFSVLLPLKIRKKCSHSISKNFTLVYSDYFEEKYIEKALESKGMNLSKSIFIEKVLENMNPIDFENSRVLICSDGSKSNLSKIFQKIANSNIECSEIYLLLDRDDYFSDKPELTRGIKILYRPVNFDEFL